MKYDVVIIGAGLGGLECGVILSKEGYNVCVLEKNPTVGGCLQTFSRRGNVLDTGIHYVGSLDDGQILNQYFRYFGVMDSLRLRKLDEGGFDTVVFRGREYRFGMGYDRFAGNLISDFPHERENIVKFCEYLKRIGGTIGVGNLRRGLISDEGMAYFGKPAYGTIAGFFRDETLRNVLAGNSGLYAGIREKTNMYHYGMITHSFVESTYRFINGSQQLADLLAAQIRNHGGCILTDSEATSVRVEGPRVKGVEVNNAEFIEAGYVISDVHPARTFELVEKTPLVKKAYLTRLSALENSYGLFTVYLIMKKGRVGYRNTNYYFYGDGDAWNTVYDYANDRPRMALLNMQASAPEQEYADVVSILCPVRTEPFLRWGDTSVGGRGEEYEAYKARLADRILEFAEGFMPGIRDAAAHVYTASPLTYRDYTATPDGTAYGIIKDYSSPLTTLIPVGTRFENLLLTGQNMNVHGALGVTVTAAITCAKLLGTEYLAKKMGNA